MKRFSHNVFLLLLFPCLLSFLDSVETADAQNTAINLHTAYSDDPKTSVWVSWRGQTNETVEYGVTTSYGSTAQASSFISAGNLQHHVELTGLNPGTRYYYRVGGTQEAGSFKTAPNGSPDFTFMIPGDIQAGARFHAPWNEAFNWVLQNHPTPVEFMLPLGDEVSHGMVQNEWDWYYTTAGEMIRNRVHFPMIGNHELYVDNAHEEFIPQLYLDQFRFPDNGHSRFRNYWYSFEHGDALFVITSWNIRPQNEQTLRAEMIEAQRVWLDEVLSQSTKKWKFVFQHAPIYSVYRTQIIEDSRPAWTEIWETNNVNAVFNGDTHFYEYSVPIYQGAQASSYADGTLYFGANAFGSSPTGGNAWWVADKQTVEDEPLISVVDVTSGTATVTTYNYQTGATRSVVVLPDRSGGTPADTLAPAAPTGFSIVP